MHHLSYSQISLFRECAKLWQASYRQGKKQVANNDLVFGSAIHQAVEARVAGQAPDLLEFWENIWPTFAQQKNVAWQISPEECYETGQRIFSSKQVLDLLDKIEPLHINGKPVIERKIEWRLDGIPEIIGYIDCIASDGVPIDFKTAGTMWSSGQARRETQPLFYLGALTDLGETDHDYRFRHFIITKGAVPTARVFETQHSWESVEQMKWGIQEVWDRIKNAEFTPNPKSWLCSTACPVFEECTPGQERWLGLPEMTNVIQDL